jgi:hypothetical protein
MPLEGEGNCLVGPSTSDSSLGGSLYSAAISAQQTMAEQTELQRPKPL